MVNYFAHPAARVFGICALILVLKMVAVGFYTSILRLRSNVFATPEDYAFRGIQATAPREDIERARRAHRNDLENILPFFMVGLLYTFTNPALLPADIYIIGYTVARVLHSIFYIGGWQPHRTIAFTVALLLMLAMLINTLVWICSIIGTP